MDTARDDPGLIEALVIELEKHALPRAMDLKEKVDQGECVDEFDTAFLADALAVATKVDSIGEHHVEYRVLAARLSHLYKEITAKALENERQVGSNDKTR